MTGLPHLYSESTCSHCIRRSDDLLDARAALNNVIGDQGVDEFDFGKKWYLWLFLGFALGVIVVDTIRALW